MEVYIAKTLGFCAFFVTTYGYLNKKDTTLKLCIAISAGLLSVHYVLLASYVAGVNLAFNSIRNQIAARKHGFPWFLPFALVQITIGIVLFSTRTDIFPMFGSLLSGYALFCQKGVRMRVLLGLCTLMWLLVNISLRSYGAILNDSLSLLVNSMGIIRIYTSKSR